MASGSWNDRGVSIDIDLVLREATTDELAALVCGAGFWGTAALPRLGVPSVRLADGPHGLRVEENGEIGTSLPATCFPPAVALGSTWDADLAHRVGAALGEEALAQGVDVILGPGVNIKRSPLCGRNFEYLSEDPLLAGVLGAALVAGMQSHGVGGCVKHFAANNQETDRMRVSAQVSERALREIYLPAFERIVTTARPWLVMSAYNAINGVSASENEWLLTDVLRGDWGYDGAVVSDWGAVQDRVRSLVAGLDLEMPHDPGTSDAALVAAVEGGEMSREWLELAAKRILELANRAATARRPDAPRVGHHDLAREAASGSIVLLANDGVLPLGPETRVALVGEFARTPRFQGGGSSQVNAITVDTLLAELGQRRDVAFAPGWRMDGALDDDLVDEACGLAQDADVVVLCLGLPDAAETEGRDRTHLRLPDNQLALVGALSEVNPRIVVCLSNGAAVEMETWRESASAIVEGWLGGQAGASALASVLVGEVDPGGRLAETIAVSLADHPSALMFPGEGGTVVYGEDVLVGYRGFDALERPVSFPFGFGLSYTTFAYADLAVERAGSVASGDLAVRVRCRITNTGQRAGSDVVQVYVGDPDASVVRPPRELRAFEKVWLAPGETAEVGVTLDARAFAFWSAQARDWVVEAGEFVVEVGPNSRDLPLAASVTLDAPAAARTLHAESTIDEWMTEHPEAFEALQTLLVEREGQRLEVPPHFLEVIGCMPLRRFALFPVGPLRASHVDEVLGRYS